MNRTKTQQSSHFDGKPTLPPIRKNNLKRLRLESSGEASNNTKRQRTQLSDEELDAYFFQSMNNRLRLLIRSVLRKNGNKKEEELNTLKQKLSTAKRLPTGIIPEAATLAQTKYNDDKDLTLKRMRNFMTNRVGKKNEIEWQDFVMNNFDNFKNEEMNNINNNSNPTSINSNTTDSIPEADTDSPVITEDSYRTCTVSLNKVIRKDLDPSVKDLIMQKLRCAIIDSTDYILCYSFLIQMIMTSLKANQFCLDGTAIDTRKVTGFDITTIVPSEFQTDSSKYTITPLPVDITNSPAFDTDFSQLFQDQHLDLIHSKYFGARGTQVRTLNAHPVQNTLFKILDAEGIKKETFPTKNLPSSVMDLALQTYMTNLKNMWADKSIINKLLDKLLTVLLRLHLAPERELSRRKYISEDHPKAAKKKKTNKPSKNKAHYILRAERKKLKKYQGKMSLATTDEERTKWATTVKKAQERIMKLEKTFKKSQHREDNPAIKEGSVDANEEKPSSKNANISRKKIVQIKSVAKHLIFSKDVISEQDVLNEIPSATRQEVSACVLITNNIKKFLPVKAKYHILAYQLYFCIFANDVLKYTKYAKFTRNLCPSMSISNINTLHLDAPSIFQLLTDKNDSNADGQPTELTIHGYNKEPITSIEIARRNKDAVFNSLFDFAMVQETCKSNGLLFAQRVSILSGLKTVRLLGTKKVVSAKEPEKLLSYTERSLKNPNVINEGQKSDQMLKTEISQSEQKIKSLKEDLEKLLDSEQENNPNKNLKILRKDWNTTTDKAALYEKIQKEKELRDSNYKRINEINDLLRQSKQTLYCKQLALRFKTKIPNNSSSTSTSSLSEEGIQRKKELKKEDKGVFSSQNCSLIKPEQFTFSGTDNGLVNMASSVPFSVKRFAFHLRLFNYYSPLNNHETIQTPPEDSNSFLNIPKAATIQSSEIDVGCGYFKNRIKLERRKKFSDDGKSILLIEKNLSESPLSTFAESVQQYKTNFERQLSHRDDVRSFYHSKQLINSQRHTEIQKHKFLHQLCRKERKTMIHRTEDNNF